jgi:hypothetical protein
MPASLSTEGQIISGLASLRMSRKEFVGICNALSVPVSESLVSICLNGRKNFSQWTGMALLNVMKELTALRDHHGIALKWDSHEIAILLMQRRMQNAEQKDQVTI